MNELILLVEDEPSIREMVADKFKLEGFRVLMAQNLKEAEKAIENRPDLILLDWMLPDGQGIDFLKKLRLSHSTLPVIMLTARAETVDRVVGLETGADDYVIKPFDIRELIARVRVRLRAKAAPGQSENQPFSVGEFRVHRQAHEVLFSGKPMELTRKEYDLLLLFLENPNQVFTRDELLNRVWGYESYPTTRTVDTHLLQLRQKSREEYFETLRGVGYRFKIFKDFSRP